MKLQASVAALLCLSSAVATAQQSIDLSMSNDTALLSYTSTISYSGAGRTDGDLGLLYTESDDVMLLGGIEMMGESGSHAPGLHGGVSIRAYAAALDNDYNIGSITLGGKLWFAPPAMNRLGLVAQLNVGPDVTTFGDADKFWDFNMRAEYEVLPEAVIYVGYRNVRAVLLNTVDIDLDKGWHAGLRMSF